MFWYPEMPSANAAISNRKTDVDDRIRPFAVLFGGRAGRLLPFLTGISFRSTRYSLASVRFSYSNYNSNDTLPNIVLGHYPENSKFSPWSDTLSIDGPGGERITSVHVRADRKSIKFVMVGFSILSQVVILKTSYSSEPISIESLGQDKLISKEIVRCKPMNFNLERQ